MIAFKHVEALKNLLNDNCDSEYYSLDIKPEDQKNGDFGIVNFDDVKMEGACDYKISFMIIYVGNNFNDLERENKALEQLLNALQSLSTRVNAFGEQIYLGRVNDAKFEHLGKDKELRRIYKVTFEMSI